MSTTERAQSKPPKNQIEDEPDPLDSPSDPNPVENPPSDLAAFSVEEEPISELFATLDDGGKIQLYRIEPRMIGTEKISGFLTDLPEGADMEWIKNQYGGGRYSIRQLVRGRYQGQKNIEIAGRPRVDPPSRDLSAQPPAPDKPAPAGIPHNQVMFEGIPIDAEDAVFLKMLRNMQLLKAAFPEKPDINDTLLTLLLQDRKNNNGSDLTTILDNMNKLKELAETVTPAAGSAPTDTFSLVIAKGIELIGKAIEAQQRGPAPRQIAAPVTEIRSAAQPVIIPESTPENPQKTEVSAMPNVREMANAACTIMVESFMADPPLPAKQAAAVIEHQIGPLDPAVKTQISSQKTVLEGMARLILSERFDTDPDLVQKFSLYFNQVYDIITAE